LVLGGTGAMGAHLITILDNKENDIFVTSRKPRNNHSRIHYIQGNAHDTNFLYPILNKKFDVIVDFMVYNTKEFSIRSKKIIENCGQYIYLSSSRVYADSKTPITENSPRLLDLSLDKDFLATDEYSLTKARQENMLINSKLVNWSIVRPYITYSEIRLQLGVLEKEQWLYRALMGKTVFFSRDIAQHQTTLTYGLNVAQGIESIVGKEKAFGEIFHITQDESCTWYDIWNIYKPIIETITQKDAKIIFSDLQSFKKFHSGKYQIEYDRLYNRVFDNTKINQFINTSNFLKPQEGLKKCLNEFLKNGMHFSHINYSYNGIVDRKTKEFLSLKNIHGIKNLTKYLIRRIGF
jgi:nucleoside-diphosphate-sugar epimerase